MGGIGDLTPVLEKSLVGTSQGSDRTLGVSYGGRLKKRICAEFVKYKNWRFEEMLVKNEIGQFDSETLDDLRKIY